MKVDGGCREGERDRPEGTLKSMVGDLEIEAGSQRHCVRVRLFACVSAFHKPGPLNEYFDVCA